MRSFALIVAVAACGGGDAAPDAAVNPDPDFDDSAAWIEVSLRTYSDGSGGDTYIDGNLITDAPLWPYDVEPVDGACRLSTRRPMTCDPPCEVDQACVGAACATRPQVRSAGLINVAGGGAIRTIPFAAAGYQLYERGLPFAPGNEITTSAPGAEVAAFSMTAVTPSSLELIGVAELRLRPATPLVLRWRPADPGSRVRITLGADLGHAQYRSVVIECDAPDEHGAVAVPQDMVDRLADPASWGCGDCFPHELRRYRRGRTTAAALPLSLWVSQRASLYLVPER